MVFQLRRDRWLVSWQKAAERTTENTRRRRVCRWQRYVLEESIKTERRKWSIYGLNFGFRTIFFSRCSHHLKLVFSKIFKPVTAWVWLESCFIYGFRFLFVVVQTRVFHLKCVAFICLIIIEKKLSSNSEFKYISLEMNFKDHYWYEMPQRFEVRVWWVFSCIAII